MDDDFADTLNRSTQVLVGINARHGPHVTPELFTVWGDRIWCLAAATTLKARLLASGGRVAVAARDNERAAVAVGSATVIDPAHPTKTTAGLSAVAQVPGAVSSFIAQNADELSGALTDAFSGKLGRPVPPHRVLLCIEPDATATLRSDGRLVAEGWDTEHQGPAGHSGGIGADEPIELLAEIPDNLRPLAGSGPAFLGWSTSAGDPLVLPVAWDLKARRAAVAEELLRVTGAASTGRAAVTRDEWTGFGPTGKQGLMLRGEGRVRDVGHGRCVEVDVDSLTYWDGVTTGSAA